MRARISAGTRPAAQVHLMASPPRYSINVVHVGVLANARGDLLSNLADKALHVQVFEHAADLWNSCQ